MAYLSTSGDLIQRTYRFLKEASATPTNWSSAQVVDYLDEAHAYVCLDLNLLQTRWVVTTSANVGLYPLSAQIASVKHVLHKSDPTQTTYTRLFPGGMSDIVAGDNDPQASGTAYMWAVVGESYATQIQVYPAPDQSAASGLYVVGNATPHPIATSASPLQRQFTPLVPLYAALLAWEELGVREEVDRLSGMYWSRRARWRVIGVDLSPDWRDGGTMGYAESDIPYGTVLRPGSWSPFDWGR